MSTLESSTPGAPPGAGTAPSAREGRRIRSREVRLALARHPEGPLASALSVLPDFCWTELADLSSCSMTHPAVKRRAEDILVTRIDAMSLGERIALARRATRRVLASLRNSNEPGVLRALLSNPRLTETDVTSIAAQPETPIDVLNLLRTHGTWGHRRGIRSALLNNPTASHPNSRNRGNSSSGEGRAVTDRSR